MWKRMVPQEFRRLRRLQTRQIRRPEDVRAFFDACSGDPAWKHGYSQRLIDYRIGLLRAAIHPEGHHVVLDVGCGAGHYLSRLARDIGHGIGIDFSDHMIAAAKESLKDSPYRRKLDFRVDRAEELRTIREGEIDAILYMGALEHMPDKNTVLARSCEVLKPGGRIVILTPNRRFLWYRLIAPALRLDTRHLSTDTFLDGRQIERLLLTTGFCGISVAYWTFIPKGDMHPLLSRILSMLDRIGFFFHISGLRGGMIATARKPESKVL
jgi:2-polyprenyl-6-hydroxyphenyl methylase/3-demethylubiquinone-9 3-methyltransferase